MNETTFIYHEAEPIYVAPASGHQFIAFHLHSFATSVGVSLDFLLFSIFLFPFESVSFSLLAILPFQLWVSFFFLFSIP